MTEHDTISSALVTARMSAASLQKFPGHVPDSMSAAYRIQSTSISRWPDEVAGWKVGMLSPHDQETYGAERLAGPIFRSQVKQADNGSVQVMPIYAGGFAAVEAEFIFRIGQAIPPDPSPPSDEALIEQVAALHIGAEIASSPIIDINSFGPTVVASDFGNNAGLLLGSEIPDWASVPPEQLPSRVWVDGKMVGEASAAAIPGGPLGALRFIVGLCASRGIELAAGTLISTGASTGIHEVTTGSKSRVEFGEIGAFEVNFVPISSRQ